MTRQYEHQHLTNNNRSSLILCFWLLQLRESNLPIRTVKSRVTPAQNSSNSCSRNDIGYSNLFKSQNSSLSGNLRFQQKYHELNNISSSWNNSHATWQQQPQHQQKRQQQQQQQQQQQPTQECVFSPFGAETWVQAWSRIPWRPRRWSSVMTSEPWPDGGSGLPDVRVKHHLLKFNIAKHLINICCYVSFLVLEHVLLSMAIAVAVVVFGVSCRQHLSFMHVLFDP